MGDLRRSVFVWAALSIFGLGLAVASAARAGATCANGGWSEEQRTALGGDSGLGGTGASGDESGLGGTGIAGDDSGLGGTGIFGTITSFGSICVNGERVHLPGDVELVFENGIAIGQEGLALGQTVWLVARPAEVGLFTEQIWILPRERAPAASAWLEERIHGAGDLARLSLEGPVDAWLDRDHFAVRGVVVEADPEVREALESGSEVRVSGAVTDGILRAETISVRPRPSMRGPVRRGPPPVRPEVDRPKTGRPDASIRPDRPGRGKGPPPRP